MNIVISLIIFFTVSLNLGAKTKITSLSFNKHHRDGKMTIHLKDSFISSPELVVKDRIIQVVLPNAIVWPKIQKNVSIHQNLDTQISAYQYTKDTVRVRAVLPYKIKEMASKINLVEKNNSIEIHFPITKPVQKDLTISKLPTKDSYDESYLEQLLQDKEDAKLKEEKLISYTDQNKKDLDRVSIQMSAPNKERTFSMMPYLGKFALFLGLILLGIFTIFLFFKKCIFNKNRLGTLGKAKIIEVLHKAYIAPKKTIMTIQAYDQIFLIGLDEKGMHFLSEIRNPAGPQKGQEQETTGSNFDTKMKEAESQGKEFNIKEILSRPAEEEKKDMMNFITNNNMDNKRKLSEHIKRKVKDLKSLQ